MADLAQLGIQVTSTGVDEAAKGMDNLADSAGKAEKATTDFAQSADKVKTATSAMAEGTDKASQAMGVFSAAVAGFVGGVAAGLIDKIGDLVDHLGEFITESIKSAANLQSMSIALDVVAKSAGYSSQQVDQTLKSFEEVGITGAKAAATLTHLAEAHITAAEASKLSKAAADLAVVGNTSVAEAMTKVTQAITTGNQFALRSLFIHADFTAAYQKEAAALGVHTDQLTADEKAQARLNAVMDAAVASQGASEKAAGTASQAMKDLANAFEDLQEEVGKLVLPAVTAFISDLVDVLKDLKTGLEDAANSDLAHWLENNLAATMQNVIIIAQLMIQIFQEVNQTFKNITGSSIVDFLGHQVVQALKDVANFGAAVVAILSKIITMFDMVHQGMVAMVKGDFGSLNTIAKNSFAQIAQIQQNYLKAVNGQGTAGTSSGSTRQSYGTSTPPAQERPPGRSHGRELTDRTDEEIAKAAAEELKARQALTGDILQSADLKKQEIQAELAQQIARVENDKHISASAKAQIIAIDTQTAMLKTELVDRQAQAALNKQQLEYQKTLTDYSDRISKAQQSIAGDAEASAALAEKSLADDQALELAQKKEADRVDVQSGKMTQADAQLQEARLVEAQAAETAAQKEKDRIATINQQAQNAKDSLQIDVDVLTARQQAAPTAIQQALMDKDILQKTQEIQRIEAQRLVDTTVIGTVAHDNAVKALNALPQIQLDQAAAKLGNAISIYDQVSQDLKGAGDAIKAHDWAHVWDGLDKSIATLISVMQNAASTVQQKAGAIGGLVSGLGNLLGGSAGSFLSGAGSGISAGGSIAGFLGISGPIGMAVGGLIGGIASLFGGNSKKKQEERDAQNQAAAQAAQKAQQEYEQHMQLELRLIEASGDAIASLNAQRQNELNSANAADQALLKQIYDQEDRKNRQSEIYDIESQYMTLTGNKLGLLTLQRQEENKSIDAAIIPLKTLENTATDAASALSDAKDALQAAYNAEISRLQDLLTKSQDAENQAQQVLNDAVSKRQAARDKLVQEYNNETSALQDLINKFTDFGKSLRAFRASLNTSGPGQSPLDAYTGAASNFSTISAKAQLGDQDALNSFQQAAQDFLNSSASFNGVASVQYQKDLQAVKSATEKAADMADRQVSNAEQQLTQLKNQVSAIIKLDDTAETIDGDIKNLLDARSAAHNAQLQVDATHAVSVGIQGQIDATNALVAPLLGINQGVLSLGQAIANYQQAQQANAQAIQALAVAIAQAKSDPNNTPAPPPATTTPAYTSTNGDYAAYVAGNKDLLQLWQQQKGMAKGRSEAEFGVYHWANFGQYENRGVRPYAYGADFMVGGQGGTDSQYVGFMASPNERVQVKTAAQQADEVKSHKETLEALNEVCGLLKQLVNGQDGNNASRSNAVKVIADKLDQVIEANNGVKRSVRKAA